MIDFHCHLDLYKDAMNLLPMVASRNKFTLAVTTSPRAWAIARDKFAKYSNIKVALGLHPEIVQQKKNELDLLLRSIPTVNYIGEVGIDGSTQYRETFPLQEDIFSQILQECEANGGRIISIHSRCATQHVLRKIAKHVQNSIPVLHWFTGSEKEVLQAIDLGCWFSIGPAMLSSFSGRRTAGLVPLDRVLPETDGPFATKNSLPLMPWDVIEVYQFLGERHRLNQDTIEEIIQNNLKRIGRSILEKQTKF